MSRFSQASRFSDRRIAAREARALFPSDKAPVLLTAKWAGIVSTTPVVNHRKSRPHSSWYCSLLAILALCALPHGAAAQDVSDGVAPLAVQDVEAAFAGISVRGRHLNARANGRIPEPSYRVSFKNLFGLWNHFQGVQRLAGTDYLVVSGSNRRSSLGQFFVIRQDDTGTGEVVASIDVDRVMWHVGGLSTLGPILAVPIHGGTPRQAKVVFYDLGTPEQPRKLPVEIERPSRKASATALTRRRNGHYLAAVVAAFDGRPLRVDFYLSRTQALEDGFAPEPATWLVSEVQARPGQERTFDHFQAINFVSQADGRLFLVGFHNTVASASMLPGRDYADLYEVVFPDASVQEASPRLEKPLIVKVANRMMRCTSGYCNMDAAAGLYIDPDSLTLSVYAAAGWLDDGTMKLTVYPGESAAR